MVLLALLRVLVVLLVLLVLLGGVSFSMFYHIFNTFQYIFTTVLLTSRLDCVETAK